MNLTRFSLYTILIGVLLFYIKDIIFIFNPSFTYFSEQYIYFIFFFGFLTALSFGISNWGLAADAEKSVLVVMGAVTVKLLVSMVFALIFIYTQKPQKLSFLLSFFLPYFIYTGFEIYSLMSNLRALKK
jgi:sensor histidine kinase YesM